MRVTSVSLISNQEEALRFDLRNANSTSQYIVRTIIGLDADELTPKFYGFSKSGKRFYDFKTKPRDVVMRVVLNPRFHLNESYSYIRDQLYRTISATRYGEVELQFYSGASIVGYIQGFVTKFEVPHFSKVPELQMTIRCEYPMIKGLNPIVMETSDIPDTNPIKVFDNVSTAPHGLQMSITMNSTLGEFVIQDAAVNPEWSFTVIPASNFLTGDVLYLSSQYKDKYLFFDRATVITHLIDRVEPDSVWPMLFPGLNELYFPQKDDLTINYLRYDATHWGI